MPNLDLWPMLETLTIKTKGAKLKKLNRNDAFAWAQREVVSEIERQYNAGEPVRIIVLKGRQLGLSTLTEAVLFLWCFLHPGTNALVLSKEKPDSEYLFSMTKRYWEMGPFQTAFSTKYNRQGYIEWMTGSSILVDTAKKEDVGRGRTLQAVHGSEVAIWPEADAIVGALNEAIPYEHGTIVIYESTARGVGGFFYEEWMKAIDPAGGKSDFTPMFFPWWEHDEYEVKNHHLHMAELDDDEREMLVAIPKMTFAKLAWRRRKLQSYSNPETFKEEYPNTQEEAFLSSGSNVFPLVKLSQCYFPDVEMEQGFLYNDGGKVAFKEDDEGHFFVYERPDPRGKRRYVVAVDPTWTIEGDPCCIQVIDRASMEQVAVWHGSADAQSIGDIALAIAYWYGPETILNTEIQGGGKTVLAWWREANYQHIWMDRRADRPKLMMQAYGWNTTYETKNNMLTTMQSIIHRKHLIIHHPATYYEMTRYIANPDGTYGPSRRSGHDDCVTSLGIGIMTVIWEQGTLDYSAAAPAPGHLPGERNPQLAGSYGRTYTPPGMATLGPMDDDAMIGIEVTY